MPWLIDHNAELHGVAPRRLIRDPPGCAARVLRCTPCSCARRSPSAAVTSEAAALVTKTLKELPGRQAYLDLAVWGMAPNCRPVPARLRPSAPGQPRTSPAKEIDS